MVHSEVLDQLIDYVEKHDFKGYDPYDALNIPLPWQKLGHKIPAYSIQVMKRLPVNIRFLLGAKPEYNPKAMGLFLHAFSLLYKKSGDTQYLRKADFFFDWLAANFSKDFAGMSWGYNFQWVSPIRNLPAYAPSAVVTAFICRGIKAYHEITNKQEAEECLHRAAQFVIKELPQTTDQTGINFSYTPQQAEICYNASLLAAEILAYSHALKPHNEYRDKALAAADFVLSRQNPDGSWNYSEKPEQGTIRKQIDFHQGYVIESLFFITEALRVNDRKYFEAINKGLKFYRQKQFMANGRPKYRLPQPWPVDIHHVAQGIITFSRFAHFDKDFLQFSHAIAQWSFQNMLSSRGYFFYRKHRFYTNKVSYMRWGQAWMLLALAESL